MRICVLTSYDSPYKGVADITAPVLMEYCQRWGYELQIRQDFQHQSGVIWARVDEIMGYHGAADWIVQLDSDMLVTNHAISLSSILENVTTEIAVGSDQNGINDGFLAVRSDKRSLVNFLWEPRKFQCFQEALATSLDQFRDRVTILPQRVCNSYAGGEYPDQDPDGVWQEGDLLLHLPGKRNDIRVELLLKHLHLIQK